jgi:signal transduction histidine kinase
VRRRLTIAILAVVTGTLVLTVAASVLLVQRAAISTAENELTPEAQTLAEAANSNPAFTDRTVVPALRRIAGFDVLSVEGLDPQGSFSDIPSPLDRSVLDSSALLNGETVSGNVGHEIFVAVPLNLTARQLRLLDIAPSDTPVLLITRHVKSPVSGIGYFLLVAGIVLVVGAAVAALLATRISAPVLESVSATGRIAGGDLSARVPVRSRDYPELKELAESINTMGESLGRAQGLGRQFLLSVSHELRTPLTSIRGYADAIADGATDDVQGAVAIIDGEARRLERLVQDLLDLARLDARQFSFAAEPVDCADLVRSVTLGFGPEAGASGIVLETDVRDAPGLWVDADPDRLGQVVANLVENAFKFAASKVVVGAGVLESSVIVWVTDDGPGIPPEDLPHVFERHFSSDRRPTRKLGTGLGLAIVAELTHAMGSTCTAESPVVQGHGTRMTVWMKARRAPEDAAPASPV